MILSRHGHVVSVVYESRAASATTTTVGVRITDARYNIGMQLKNANIFEGDAVLNMYNDGAVSKGVRA